MTANDLHRQAEELAEAIDAYGGCGNLSRQPAQPSCMQKALERAKETQERTGKPFSLGAVAPLSLCHWCEAFFFAYRAADRLSLLALLEHNAQLANAGKKKVAK